MTSIKTTPLPLAPGRWVLDPMHSQVGFAIRHLGVSKVRGRFAEVDGTLLVDATGDNAEVTATIPLASIDTGNTDRDAHVRSDEFLDVQQRSTMTFRSTRVQVTDADGEQARLDGELTIGQITQPVSFDVTFGGVETSVVDQRPHAGFEATGQLRRRDFGLSFGPGEAILGDRVTIDLDIQFIAPEGA